MEISPRVNTPFSPGNGADSIVKQAAGSVHGTLDKMAASVDEAAADVQPAIARVAKIAHQTVDKVADAAAPTAAWLSRQGETLQSAQRNAVADARVYISANPWQSIGIAVAAGFLIGRWAR